jgi:uncharacterized protein (DUF2235 family)
MIYNVGLLPEATVAPLLIRRAYDMYRNRMEGTKPGQLLATDFHKKYNTIVPHIEFLGCFDTVGALGVPKLPWYLGGSLCKFINIHK